MTMPTLPKLHEIEKHKKHLVKDRTPMAFDIATERLRGTECPLPNEIKIEATKALRPFSKLNFGALPQLGSTFAKS